MCEREGVGDFDKKLEFFVCLNEKSLNLVYIVSYSGLEDHHTFTKRVSIAIDVKT